MEERRNIKRLNSFIQASYNNKNCFITDITYEGASIFLNEITDLKKDSIIEIEIDLSNITYVINKKITITSKIMWVKFENNHTFAGLMFINPEEKEDIDILVKNWESLKPE